MDEAIVDLQSRLEQRAQPAKKAWWERYLKGVISFRGVPMADIRRTVREWIPDSNRTDLGLSLIREPIADDKLAGVLVFAEHVIPSGEASGAELLPAFSELFSGGHIADWNTCDWFCMKVLNGLLEREGEAIAPAIAEWRHADTLWQRRAASVAFVLRAPEGDANWPGFVELLLEVCHVTSGDPERFAQTGVGWTLREISKSDPNAVQAFVDTHDLSREARRMALAKISGRGRR